MSLHSLNMKNMSIKELSEWVKEVWIINFIQIISGEKDKIIRKRF